MRVLVTTPPIPADLVVASTNLEASHGPRISEALESLPAETRTAEALRTVVGAEGFRRCNHKNLRYLKRQVDDAAARGLSGL